VRFDQILSGSTSLPHAGFKNAGPVQRFFTVALISYRRSPAEFGQSSGTGLSGSLFSKSEVTAGVGVGKARISFDITAIYPCLQAGSGHSHNKHQGRGPSSSRRWYLGPAIFVRQGRHRGTDDSGQRSTKDVAVHNGKLLFVHSVLAGKRQKFIREGRQRRSSLHIMHRGRPLYQVPRSGAPSRLARDDMSAFNLLLQARDPTTSDLWFCNPIRKRGSSAKTRIFNAKIRSGIQNKCRTNCKKVCPCLKPPKILRLPSLNYRFSWTGSFKKK